MMEEEISASEPDVHEKDAKIMDELEEAALTNVTQAAAHKEGSPALSTSSSMTQSSEGLSMLPPPSLLPPELTSPVSFHEDEPSTPPPPTSGFIPQHIPMMSSSPPKSSVDFSVPAEAIFTPEVPTEQAAPPYSTPSAYASTYSPVAPGAMHCEESDLGTLGPVYAAPGDETQASRGGFFGWGGKLVNKVMEKTKSSVESVITTLDPGMKEVIYSGGDIDIIVTSTKDAKVTAIRDAFQEVFGKATVTGMESQPNIAPQPVGYSAGLKGAEERIENLRRSNAVHEHQVVVSIENFIVEMLPDCWFDVACVLLKDPLHNIEIQVFSQSTPVHLDYVQMAQDATPTDYNLSWSGLSVTVGEMIERSDPRICRSDWHQHLSGVSRRQIVTLAGKALASLYQRQRHAPQI